MPDTKAKHQIEHKLLGKRVDVSLASCSPGTPGNSRQHGFEGAHEMNSWSVASVLCLLSVAGAGCKGPEASPAPAAPSASGAATVAAAPAAAPEAPKGKDTSPIKIGILHSLSGTMAISETSLKDVALMTIEDINKKGGVLGRQIEPIVVDPASNWPLFAEKARELIQKGVSVVFGCWTSVSRKSVLPV